MQPGALAGDPLPWGGCSSTGQRSARSQARKAAWKRSVVGLGGEGNGRATRVPHRRSRGRKATPRRPAPPRQQWPASARRRSATRGSPGSSGARYRPSARLASPACRRPRMRPRRSRRGPDARRRGRRRRARRRIWRATGAGARWSSRGSPWGLRHPATARADRRSPRSMPLDARTAAPAVRAASSPPCPRPAAERCAVAPDLQRPERIDVQRHGQSSRPGSAGTRRARARHAPGTRAPRPPAARCRQPVPPAPESSSGSGGTGSAPPCGSRRKNTVSRVRGARVERHHRTRHRDDRLEHRRVWPPTCDARSSDSSSATGLVVAAEAVASAWACCST